MKKIYLLDTLSVCVLTLTIFTATAAPVPGKGTWETTLQGRDLDGNATTFEAYYDTVLDITWLADSSLAASNSFGVSDIDPRGLMVWDTANDWIAAMNSSAGTGYLGFSDWRLPTVSPVNGSNMFDVVNWSTNGTTDLGFGATGIGWMGPTGTIVSELGYMYYANLGNLGYCLPDNTNPSLCTQAQDGWGLVNTGPFVNMSDSDYWTGIDLAPDYSDSAMAFDFHTGEKVTSGKRNGSYVWAVRDGDVAAVPTPDTIWLFGSGLLGLIGVSRRK